VLNPEYAHINVVTLGDNGRLRHKVLRRGPDAVTMIRQLNKLDLRTISLLTRLLTLLAEDPEFAGDITDTP
jgi:hypothetical protein